MRMAESIAITLLRAGLVTAMAWPVAWWLSRYWRTATVEARRARLGIAGLGLLVWLTPPLLLAYAWNRVGLSVIQSEVVYLGLVTLRMIPLALLLILWGPAEDLSPSARWMAGQLRRQGRAIPFGPRLRGAIGRWKWAIALVLLIAFQEFELSALLGVRTWTDDLFVDHAGGLPLSESLRLALLPTLISLALALVGQSRGFSTSVVAEHNSHEDGFNSRSSWLCAGSFVAWCLLATLLFLPLMIMIANDSGGMLRYLLQGGRQRGVLVREMITGLLLGGTATLLAMGLAAYTTAPRIRNVSLGRWPFSQWPLRHWLGTALLTLGLLGALPLGLLLRAASLGVADLTGTSAMRNTLPLWLLLGIVLKVFPLAWLVETMLKARRPAASLAVADSVLSLQSAWRDRRVGPRLIGVGSPAWEELRSWRFRVARQPRLWLGLLITTFACADVLLTALLAPTGMATGTVRLYNFMHYGHSAALTTEALLLAFIPFATLLLLVVIPVRAACRRDSPISPLTGSPNS